MSTNLELILVQCWRKPYRRLRRWCLLAGVVISLSSCAIWLFGLFTPLQPAAAAISTVQIEGNAYSPATLTVNVGDSVSWVNRDSVQHTSTANSGLWRSGNLSQFWSYTFIFSSPGTYAYRCDIHPSMSGTIVVQGISSPTAVPGQSPSPTASPTATPTASPTRAASTPAATSAPAGTRNPTATSVSSVQPTASRPGLGSTPSAPAPGLVTSTPTAAPVRTSAVSSAASEALPVALTARPDAGPMPSPAQQRATRYLPSTEDLPVGPTWRADQDSVFSSPHFEGVTRGYRMDDSNNEDVSYQLQVSVAIASSQEQAATVFHDTVMALTSAGYQLEVAENTIGDETVLARSPTGAAGQFPSNRSVLYFRAAGITVMIGFRESTDMPIRDYAITMARLIEANINLDANPMSAE